MLDSFWNGTNSCLKTMMITKDELRQSNETFKLCNRYGHRCAVKGNVQALPNRPLLFEDYTLFSFSNRHLYKINHLNLSVKFRTIAHFKKLMYRLILNPSEDVQNLVLQQLTTYPASFTGMHIRSAGKLANKQEASYWLTEKELPQLSSFISHTIQGKHLSETVYLTTDSDKVEAYLKGKLTDLHFLVRPPLKRYHSTSDAKTDAIKGALFDAYITAQSSTLFYTSYSMYSTLLINLSKSTKIIRLPLKYRVAKRGKRM